MVVISQPTYRNCDIPELRRRKVNRDKESLDVTLYCVSRLGWGGVCVSFITGFLAGAGTDRSRDPVKATNG